MKFATQISFLLNFHNSVKINIHTKKVNLKIFEEIVICFSSLNCLRLLGTRFLKTFHMEIFLAMGFWYNNHISITQSEHENSPSKYNDCRFIFKHWDPNFTIVDQEKNSSGSQLDRVNGIFQATCITILSWHTLIHW